MRFVILAALSIVSTLIAGSWAQILEIGGIQIDIVLLIIVSLALLDRTSMPIIFAACTGLLIDLCYSTVIGCTALAYMLTAAAVFFLAQRADRISLLMVVAAGGGAFLLKNGLIALILRATETLSENLSSLFLRYVLPGALFCALLMIPAYWLLSKLMHQRFMRARRQLVDEF